MLLRRCCFCNEFQSQQSFYDPSLGHDAGPMLPAYTDLPAVHQPPPVIGTKAANAQLVKRDHRREPGGRPVGERLQSAYPRWLEALSERNVQAEIELQPLNVERQKTVTKAKRAAVPADVGAGE
ncbi:Fc.00g108980.m01.CDS01 [Cosmosporella sp. VM-42]